MPAQPPIELLRPILGRPSRRRERRIDIIRPAIDKSPDREAVGASDPLEALDLRLQERIALGERRVARAGAGHPSDVVKEDSAGLSQSLAPAAYLAARMDHRPIRPIARARCPA